MDLSIFGWVGQDGDNIHKKHDFKIHFRPFYILLIQVAPYACICCHNPPPLQHPSMPMPTNTTHYYQPLTPTTTIHHNKPPLIPPTTSNHHCHHPPWWLVAVWCISGWWQQMMGPVEGSGGWLSEKIQNFFVFQMS